MIIAQLSISPLGQGTSVSRYVKLVLKTLKEENIHFETNAMSTIIETPDLPTLFNAVHKAHNTLLTAGAQRIITEIKIDDRHDKNATISSKIGAIK